MDRRAFPQASLSAAALGALGRRLGVASRSPRRRPARTTGNLLVLVELKGGNDGLNTRRPVRRSGVLRAAPEARDRARRGRAALGPRRPASGARAAAAALEGPAARGAAGRRLSGAQPVAFPLDRDLGHRVEERRIPAGRLADARVRARARRRAASPPTASSSARNDLGPLAGGGTRAIALAEHRAVPAPGAARAAGRRRAQQGARAHPQGRGRHRAGGGAPRRAPRVRDRVSAGRRSATRSGPRARSSPIRPAWRSCA